MNDKKKNGKNGHLNDIFMRTPIASANETTGSGNFYKSTLYTERIKQNKKRK